MNKTPSILVDTGFEVDANGVLTEIVTPSVVKTLNVPTKVTFLGETINWIPSTTAALLEFNAPNATAISGDLFLNYTNVTKITLPQVVSLGANNTKLFANCTNLVTVDFSNLESIACGGNANGTFLNCSSLTTLNMPKLSSITCTDGSNDGIFKGCTSLTSITLPSLRTIQTANKYAPFYGLTGLLSITLPKLNSTSTTNTNWGAFYGLTGLQSVQLGSEGNPVASLVNSTFIGCTQSGLTITIYTSGGAALSGSPWGATNATIEYEEA